MNDELNHVQRDVKRTAPELRRVPVFATCIRAEAETDLE